MLLRTRREIMEETATVLQVVASAVGVRGEAGVLVL